MEETNSRCRGRGRRSCINGCKRRLSDGESNDWKNGGRTMRRRGKIKRVVGRVCVCVCGGGGGG